MNVGVCYAQADKQLWMRLESTRQRYGGRNHSSFWRIGVSP